MFGEQNSVSVWLEVTAPSHFSCFMKLFVTLMSGNIQSAWECGDEHQCASFSWRGVALCPWLVVLSQMTVLLASSSSDILVLCGSCVQTSHLTSVLQASGKEKLCSGRI